jgi:hypothetical protein
MYEADHPQTSVIGRKPSNFLAVRKAVLLQLVGQDHRVHSQHRRCNRCTGVSRRCQNATHGRRTSEGKLRQNTLVKSLRPRESPKVHNVIPFLPVIGIAALVAKQAAIRRHVVFIGTLLGSFLHHPQTIFANPLQTIHLSNKTRNVIEKSSKLPSRLDPKAKRSVQPH